MCSFGKRIRLTGHYGRITRNPDKHGAAYDLSESATIRLRAGATFPQGGFWHASLRVLDVLGQLRPLLIDRRLDESIIPGIMRRPLMP